QLHRPQPRNGQLRGNRDSPLGRGPCLMQLTWELCDLNQTVLSRLDDRQLGATVELPMNDMRTATCPLSIEDPAVAMADAVDTVLRVTADTWEQPVFIGRVYVPDQKGNDGNVTLTAYDSMKMLSQDYIHDLNTAPVTDQLESHTFFDDQSQIL